MANEYLRRTPTSSGNSRKWSVSFWMKNSDTSQGYTAIMGAGKISPNNIYNELYFNGSQIGLNLDNAADPENYVVNAVPLYRDSSAWMHVLVSFTDQGDNANTRIKFYINGVLQNNNTGTNLDITETTFWNNSNYIHYIGSRAQQSAGTTTFKAQFSDIFLVDGQALTPDVFGYYKKGDGYISAGSTQATDFKKGQWVPKAPKVIRSVINARGGFGVNGFYLPMNDDSNFGADFHCEPNSIIKLKGENFDEYPQPRNGAPETTDAYVSQLRTDPYAANLVLAMPLISGGKDGGYGDYSADIKGSGSNKSVRVTGAPSVTGINSSLYYGSALVGNNDINNYLTVTDSGSDFRLDPAAEDWTIEFWTNPYARSTPRHTALLAKGSATTNNSFDWRFYIGVDVGIDYDLSFGIGGYSGDDVLGDGNQINLPKDQWHHIVVEARNGVLTEYINGVAVGINTSPRAQTTNHSQLQIFRGDIGGAGDVGFVGALSDLRIYSGVAKYKGGFDVPKPYTPVGIATWRAVPDTTANNFATLNPLEQTNGLTTLTFSEGNNRIIFGGSSYNTVYSTVGVTTGKYYFECRFNTQHVSPGIGGNNTNPTVRVDSGGIYLNDVLQQSGLTSQASGQIFGIALDRTNSSVQFYLNGSTFGSAQSFSANSGQEIFAHIMSQNAGASSDSVWNFGQNPTFSGNTTAGTFTDTNSKGLFKYEPPTGFLALCEDNLPTPAISDPGKYFKTVLYTGDGNSGRSITGVGFTPDLVWIKDRGSTAYNYLFDSVRGGDAYLWSNDTGAEGSIYQKLSFNANGFSLINGTDGSYPSEGNRNGNNIVAWCWRAGAGTTSTNTDGSITSVVSVNQTAGFSIVSYTANQTSGATVGHGLGKTPKMIIVKQRSGNTNNWPVYHAALGNTKAIYLDLTVDQGGNFTGAWNNTSPTSSVFSLGNSVETNRSGSPYIAYCWTEIEGYSKFGSYVGNGNADGPFVYCGFKPAFIMFKNADATGNWVMSDSSRDSNNPVFGYQVAEDSAIEERGTAIFDFLSNGFKIRNSWTDINASGGTIIFAVFAESPFKTANAK
jgi:hypothetical protein